MELDLGKIGDQKMGDIVDVALHIIKELCKPFVALIHSGLGSYFAKDITEMSLHIFDIGDIGLAKVFIGNDGRRGG